MKKRIMKGLMPVLALAMCIGFSSFVDEGEGGTPPSGCPKYACVTGGCGSNSCSYTKEIFGFNRTVSVTSNTGYYACCGQDGNSNMFANSYPNKCCN